LQLYKTNSCNFNLNVKVHHRDTGGTEILKANGTWMNTDKTG
jgi:hypothetical protein